MRLKYFILLSFKLISEISKDRNTHFSVRRYIKDYQCYIHYSSNIITLSFTKTMLTTAAASTIAARKHVDAPLKEDTCLELHLSCKEGRLASVNYILSQEPRYINCRGKRGLTPLLLAARQKMSHVVEYLVDHACNTSLADDRGYNALHYACIAGSEDIAGYLLDKHLCHIESKDKQLKTPVMLTVGGEYNDLFDMLVRYGARLDGVDYKGETILHLSSYSGNAYIVKYMISHKVTDKDGKGRNDRTPVMLAAQKGHTEIVKYLIDNGCDQSLVDNRGNTILHLACYKHDKFTVAYVLSSFYELDGTFGINKKNKFGYKAIDIARKSGSDDIVAMIEAYTFID